MSFANPSAEFPDRPLAGTGQGSVGGRAIDQSPSNAPTAAARLLESTQTFKDVKTWMKVFENRSNMRVKTARAIAESIQSFHMFCDGYIRKLSSLADNHGTRLSWLECTIDNVLLDYWEPILRAAEQNRAAHYRPLFRKGYAKLEALQKDLEKRLNIGFDANLVLYFERVGRAKRYPFGNTYLIGVPLIDAYRDNWMAIPHELGHHLFWKARFSETDLTLIGPSGRNLLEDELNAAMAQLTLGHDDPARATIRRILHGWTEEVFADVVGARIGGKEFVEGAWDRISRRVETKEGLFESDGEHPIQYFVPSLRATAANEALEDRWQELFGGQIEFTELAPNPKVEKPLQDPPIKIADLQAAVQNFVGTIRNKLRNIQLDQLVAEHSSLADLKSFEMIMSRELDERMQSEDLEMKRLRALLTPFILERGEEWTCKNDHAGNPSGADFCQTCRIARNIWSYLPF